MHLFCVLKRLQYNVVHYNMVRGYLDIAGAQISWTDKKISSNYFCPWSDPWSNDQDFFFNTNSVWEHAQICFKECNIVHDNLACGKGYLDIAGAAIRNYFWSDAWSNNQHFSFLPFENTLKFVPKGATLCCSWLITKHEEKVTLIKRGQR